jgi:hypothetical protein
LVPTRRERWIRLAWPWGVLSAIAIAALLGSEGWWFLPFAAALLGWGTYEFGAPSELVFGPWALHVTHLGRTRKVSWRSITAAVPGGVLDGQFVRIAHRDSEVRGFMPYLVLHYGYGYSAVDLAMLINDRRTAVVPDEPHPFTRERLRRLDRVTLIAIPIVMFGVALLMVLLGVIP